MLPYGYGLDRLTFPSISDQFLASKIPSKVLPRSMYRQSNNHVPRSVSLNSRKGLQQRLLKMYINDNDGYLLNCCHTELSEIATRAFCVGRSSV